jgi:hypothetical protein
MAVARVLSRDYHILLAIQVSLHVQSIHATLLILLIRQDVADFPTSLVTLPAPALWSGAKGDRLSFRPRFSLPLPARHHPALKAT